MSEPLFSDAFDCCEKCNGDGCSECNGSGYEQERLEQYNPDYDLQGKEERENKFENESRGHQ